MTNHLRHNLLFLFALTVFSILSEKARGQQDCFDAINVCSSTYVQNTSYSGTGFEDEVPSGTSCLGNEEVNSVWYTFTATSSGSLEFQLNPLNPNDDYDFALYDLTNDSCTGISAGLNLPLSCNYSAGAGSTGLSSVGIGNNNGSSDSNQNQPINVQAGQVYALLICNFTASQNGYELNFSGSASIGDTEASTPDSVSTRTVCNPRDIYLFFDEPFDCSTISSDGSEVSVNGPSNCVVSSVSGIGCQQGYTDQIRIRLTDKIQVVGTYTITINSGSDGDSFSDGCGNEVIAGTSYQFEVLFIGPDVGIINIQHTSCGQSSGQAEANVTSGTPPYTYSWNTSPSQTTALATNLEPGAHRVTVYDENGCRDRATVIIENDSPLDLTAFTTTAVSCNGVSDGSAELIPAGGVTPYSILWQTNPAQNGQIATGLPAGEIIVSVTDDTGCEEIVEIDIPGPPPISLFTSITNPDCAAANGSATAIASGGTGNLSYEWNTVPVQTTETASNLSAGVFMVEVTDQNGCQQSSNVILTDNFAPNAAIESTVPDCGQSNGQATALVISGTDPYLFNWNTNPPQNTATASGLSEGDYFVTITDAAGCVQIIYVKIDAVPEPQLSAELTQPGCGMMDGEIAVEVTNGIEPFSFNWSSSSNNSSIEGGLAEGNYTVTLVDSSGCVVSETYDLSQLEPESQISTDSVCLGQQSSFSFTTNSGATSWVWDFGDGNSSTDQNPTHIYSNSGSQNITLTLEGGCMPDQVTGTTEVFEQPTADFTYSPEIPTTSTDVEFVTSGTGGTSFLWDFGDGSTETGPRPSHQYEVDGVYDVLLTVTDDNGCQDTTTITLEVLIAPVIFFPNAIIIEGTENNNHFQGYGIGVTSAELCVFDRWGTMIYYSADLNEIMSTGWNGKFNGTLVKQGAYPYKVKASFYNGSSFEKLGTVTVIR